MPDISSIFSQTTPTYQRPEDIDFPVSKVRFFLDVLWQAVTGKQLTDEQRVTLKQLIDVLNLLDEHKHESQKELIAAMLPSISPLLQKMPTLGLTGTHVFTHLVPMYQLYLPSIERLVKDAHHFSQEETLLYYELTIFDHLFLVHLFEQEQNINMIELILTIKAIILINALVYDYHQHVDGRSISFFTFLMRGGVSAQELLPFLTEAVGKLKDEVKATVQNRSCLDTLEFVSEKLMETTQKTDSTQMENEQKETAALDTTMLPSTPQLSVDAVFNQVTETPVEEVLPMTPQAPTTPNPVPPPTPEPMPTPPVAPMTVAPVTPAPLPPQSMPTPEAPVVPAPQPVVTPPESPVSPAATVPPPPPTTPEVTTTPPASPLAESPTLTPQTPPPGV